jgi:hypothetical protein
MSVRPRLPPALAAARWPPLACDLPAGIPTIRPAATRRSTYTRFLAGPEDGSCGVICRQTE